MKLWFLLPLFFLAACSQHDTSANNDDLIRQKIIGTWVVDRTASEGGGSVTFLSDGSSMSGWTNTTTNGVIEWHYGAVWQVANGVLTATITKAEGSGRLSPIGHATQFKIVQVDSHDLVWTEEFPTYIQTTHLKRGD